VPEFHDGGARSHVNRKALDEYATFMEQRTELKRRQEENAKGEDKINQLIRTLDLRKEEAIERTFKVACLSLPPPIE
jgi:structural maintenance of chromosome 3 (chondroitin sulfate proteoglycan 6)